MLVFGLKMLVLSQNTTIKEKFTRHIPKNGSKKPAPARPKQAQNWKNKIYCNLSEMSGLLHCLMTTLSSPFKIIAKARWPWVVFAPLVMGSFLSTSCTSPNLETVAAIKPK
jgi:hypothetical protein